MTYFGFTYTIMSDKNTREYQLLRDLSYTSVSSDVSLLHQQLFRSKEKSKRMDWGEMGGTD